MCIISLHITNCGCVPLWWWALMTELNTLIRDLCLTKLGLFCRLTNNLPQTTYRGETGIFPPLNQGCYSTLRSSNIKMRWHNNQDTILLWPVIMRINPPYHHFPYSLWLRAAATKLEHNLPKSWGVKKTRSITQRILARSGYFQKKQRWTSPGNSDTAEGLLLLVGSASNSAVWVWGHNSMSYREGSGLVSWPYSTWSQNECYNWISNFDFRVTALKLNISWGFISTYSDSLLLTTYILIQLQAYFFMRKIANHQIMSCDYT